MLPPNWRGRRWRGGGGLAHANPENTGRFKHSPSFSPLAWLGYGDVSFATGLTLAIKYHDIEIDIL